MSIMKRALITGVTGQDGAYLSHFLLNKGYEVHGMLRRNSLPNTSRLDQLISKKGNSRRNLHLHFGDLSDGSMITRLMLEIKPDEVYNLAAQSHVKISFDLPEYTADVDGLGTLRILEAIRSAKLLEKTKFYQASTSELYGKVQETPQNEETPFYPRSPYGCAKLYSFWCTVNYREAYNLFACNGILFNHESSLRGENFITRKVTLAVSRIITGSQDHLYLGNLDAKRDWGHARDYVKAQWLILQQDIPEDFVIATGVQHSVRDLCDNAFSNVGITLEWKGEGIEEKGYIANVNIKKLPEKFREYSKTDRFKKGDAIVSVNPEYFRPTEVETLLGDAGKAYDKLNWKPETSFEKMIKEMVESDLRQEFHG